MFALVDCNNFYASCERVFNPTLIGKPVVILSNNDGCVVARSNEAKSLGIPMGAPAYQYQELFKKNSVHVFSSNYALYGDMSNRVMTILESFCPLIEIYSIDEAFLHFEGFKYFDLDQIGRCMFETVSRCTGIPVSIGFAPTKSLAKVANRIAKKYPTQTGGVYLLDTPEKVRKALSWLKIEDIWGIGRQQAKKLRAHNIQTALDFTSMTDEWVLKHLTVVGLRLKHDLSGIPTLRLEEQADKKNITCSRSFESAYTAYEPILERLITFAAHCAEKLRRQESDCNRLLVFIHTNRFSTEAPQNNASISLALPFPTNSNIELAHFCKLGLDRIYKAGYRYKKAGVIVQELTPAAHPQTGIFENTNPRHSHVFAVVDQINKKLGQQKVKLAAQDLGRTWKMKQERRSPRYTTQLSEIIVVKAI